MKWMGNLAESTSQITETRLVS